MAVAVMAPPEVPATAVPITGASGTPPEAFRFTATADPVPLALMAATLNENVSPVVSLLKVYERVDADTTADHGFVPPQAPASRLTRSRPWASW